MSTHRNHPFSKKYFRQGSVEEEGPMTLHGEEEAEDMRDELGR